MKPEDFGSVSYTHLRAHETVLDLVCRLLLEKKKYTKPEHICEQYTYKREKTHHIAQHEEDVTNQHIRTSNSTHGARLRQRRTIHVW